MNIKRNKKIKNGFMYVGVVQRFIFVSYYQKEGVYSRIRGIRKRQQIKKRVAPKKNSTIPRDKFKYIGISIARVKISNFKL